MCTSGLALPEGHNKYSEAIQPYTRRDIGDLQ